ncbi:MAG TPA: flagellar basal body-associated FliL family protein [Mesorhizobium sp.]|jgi:flagellar FliL protein|nr:flagellar basal body-associated FliL family protein [Mesorhizobium sp.]
MAAPSNPPADAAVPKKGPSLVVQGGVLLMLTLLAAGMGWFAGGRLGPSTPPAQAALAAGDAHGEAEGAHGEEHAAAPGHPTIIPLAPINTNLAAPDDVWVRMDLSLEFREAPEPGLADSIHQDILAFIRTVKLHQVEGASGFMHLRADLDERAKIRSGGKASRVLIRTLLFE